MSYPTSFGSSEGAAAPAIQVLRGAADDVELAALVAGLTVQAAAAERHDAESHPLASEASETLAWADRRRAMRPAVNQTWRTGPDAWRWSGR